MTGCSFHIKIFTLRQSKFSMKFTETHWIQTSADFLQWPFCGKNSTWINAQRRLHGFPPHTHTKTLPCQTFAAYFPFFLYRGLSLFLHKYLLPSKTIHGLTFSNHFISVCKMNVCIFFKCTIRQSNSKSQYSPWSWVRTAIFQVPRKKKHRSS